MSAQEQWTFTTGAAPDTTPPDTTITSQPNSSTNSTSPSFSFTSTEGGSTFECQLDSGGYSSCTSPKSYAGVSEGSHTFDVRATDSAGNTDASPASYTWTIDTTVPNTSITSQPSSLTNSTTASFSFTSTEGGSTFECQLDAGGYSSCTSPKSYLGVAAGAHTFYVRAIDPAGNTDPSPASYSWTIDTTAPTVSLVNPSNGATDVAINTTATATFSEAMNSSDITADNITVSGGVTGTVTYDSGSRTATFTPDANLSYSTTYTVTIAAGIRDLAGNSMSAQEQWTFTTVLPPDTTAPSNTTAADFINTGAASTTSSTVTLSLASTDAIGVTAYYASENSTTPTAGQGGWTAIASTTNYSADVSFSITKTLGTHTVYVWFKDAAGNVSDVASDTISLGMGVTAIVTGDTPNFVSVAIDSANKLHITYKETALQDLKYTTNASGEWVVTTVDNEDALNIGSYASIAIDSSNNAHISYAEGTNRKLRYATNSGGSWVVVDSMIDDTANQANTSLALDSSNNAHISYYSNTSTLKYVTNTGGGWTIGEADSGFSTGYLYTSIAMDSSNKAHISYLDGNITALKQR
jgi:hypothetical protein